MTSTIFTIARQYGSGGRQIGKKIAERLEIPFYDKELIAMAAKQSGMSEAIFEKADEKASSSLIYSLLMGTYAYNAQLTPNDLPVNDKLFLLQTNIIKQVAQKGPCVIVGRCGDYILRDNPNCFNIYVYALKQSTRQSLLPKRISSGPTTIISIPISNGERPKITTLPLTPRNLASTVPHS